MNNRSPIEVALNSLHVALRKAADQYGHTAELAKDAALTAALRELAAKREEQGQELEGHIRRVGLPRMPHPEREVIEKVVTQLKAALSGDPREALLKSQQPLEQEIAQAGVAALQEDLPEDTRQFVHAVIEDVIGSQERLADLHLGSPHPGPLPSDAQGSG